MDFTQLETKLQEIKKRKESLKKEIDKSKKGLISIKNVLGSDWWYSTNYLYSVVDDGEKLQIELPENQHIYFSYKENNVNFSLAPSFPIFLDEQRTSCEMIGTASKSVKVTLHLIGYKANQKVKFFKVPLNEKMTIECNKEEMDSFRIAVKLEGSGYFNLEKIKLGSKIIEGFQTFEGSSNTDVISSVLTLDRDFTQVLEVDVEALFIPSIFSTYVEKQGVKLKSFVPKGKYAYLQKSEGPLFHFNRNDLTERINPENHYELGLAADTSKNASIELVVVGYSSEHTPVEVKTVKNNSKELLNFSSDTNFVKLVFRVQGEGNLSNIKVGLNEKPRKSTFEMNVNLNKDEWFIPKNSESKLTNHNEKLMISAEASKTRYLSYQVKNISFSKVTKESAFDVKPNFYYEFEIAALTEGKGTITPIIITYTEDEKDGIINLKLNEVNKIRFKESIKYCRLAFKVSGTSQITVEDFKVTEFPILAAGGEIEWLDTKEVSHLGLISKRDLSQVKMAAIFDEFTTQCFAHECQLITFTPENWKDVLTAAQPDLLMVESAWRGNNGAWIKKIQYVTEESVKELKELLLWCKENNVPTVFWNKEDPVHYDHFIETAKLFDFVLTTDANMVPVYKEACGHDRVDYLQFAAQVEIHNPITLGERENAVSFAGSYYAKHVERTEDMMRIFDAVIPYGLAIFDRNFEKVKQGLLPNNRFPEHVEPYVRGSLKYYEIDKAYKGFKALININTVKYSPTMFARRVFEALACGTPIISNYSEGIEKMFGDIVCISSDEQVIKDYLKMLFEDNKQYREIVLKGIRRVFSEHTYSHRLERIVEMLSLPFYRKATKLLVLGKVSTLEEARKLIALYLNQTVTNKELCLVVQDDMEQGQLNVADDSMKIFKESDFFETYQSIIEYGDFDYITYLSANIEYDSNHLLDLSLASLYAPWEILTVNKEGKFLFGQVHKVEPNLSIYKKDLFGLLSTKEMFEFITENYGMDLIQKRGARVLGIPHL